MQTHTFDAEVRQLLDLVIHSLYSDREVFLRELISNASDALDRARIVGLEQDLRAAADEPTITIHIDPVESTITVEDNGIGLTAEQAIEQLGTIARSGTKAFAKALEESDAPDLIGQFGVGFYAALMVADLVTVDSLSAVPDTEAVRWTCDGSTEYTVSESERAHRGTTVTLKLKENAFEFLDEERLKAVIKHHSDYVRHPIRLNGEQVNEPTALWARKPSEVSDDEYKEFYRQVTGDWGEPATWKHIHADAPSQYKAVLFIPALLPHDLNYPDSKRPLRLYAHRVLIEAEARALLPEYLRFVRGVVDSEDLKLNVSREMVQQTAVVKQLGDALVSQVLRHLKKLGKSEPEEYAEIWKSYGSTLKEGIHGDVKRRDKLVELARFDSTRFDAPGQVSLKEYTEAMPEGQDEIWYLTGPDRATVSRSPLLEGFRKKGWEVLLLTDPVDEWVVSSLPDYDGKTLLSAARGELDLEDEAEPETAIDSNMVDWIEALLKGQVKSVRLSNRLTDSASVLVDDTGDIGSNMARILQQMNKDLPTAMRILEINPQHSMVRTLERLFGTGRTAEAEPLAHLLLDQARLVEGRIEDPVALVQRLEILSSLAAQALGVGPVVETAAEELSEVVEATSEAIEPEEIEAEEAAEVVVPDEVIEPTPED